MRKNEENEGRHFKAESQSRKAKMNRKGTEIYGGIAQLGEHLLCKQGVSGSIPLISTKRENPSHEARE